MKSLSCPNRHCPPSRNLGTGAIIRPGFYTTRFYTTRWGKRRRYQCQACGKTFCSTTGTPYHRIHHRRVAFDEVASLSVEGLNKSAIARTKQITFHEKARCCQDSARAGAAQQKAAFAEQRLGGTAAQFAAWYGVPNDSPGLDKNFPLLNDAIHHSYVYEGWRIRAAFVPPDGRAVRMEYSKVIKAGVNATIQDYELQAIMAANTPPGASWKQIIYNNPDSLNKGTGKIVEGYFAEAPGEKMWQRNDDATFEKNL
jgi:transposase-like protein